jgi:hypothetical protein
MQSTNDAINDVRVCASYRSAILKMSATGRFGWIFPSTMMQSKNASQDALRNDVHVCVCTILFTSFIPLIANMYTILCLEVYNRQFAPYVWIL